MSEGQAAAFAMDSSALSSEKVATLPAPSTSPSVPRPKLRSCVVCRTRKVRCDKKSPCSNCRRANTACIFPATERQPRWARRFEHGGSNTISSDTLAPRDVDPHINQVLDRLHNLEDLVKELSGQLEQARATMSSSRGASSSGNSPGSADHSRDAEKHGPSPASVQNQFGRLVLQDPGRIRYVSSSFWSRIDDELHGLKMDTRGLSADESESSDDDASPEELSSTAEFSRTPLERHAFLFRQDLTLSSPALDDLHPLPSQIPFLLEIFSERVNIFIRIVHMPTITEMVRNLRDGRLARLTPSNEALMFSIYYAAIIAMEEDEVLSNFGTSKSHLSFNYRVGLEQALAGADFLNKPDLVLAQAFTVFLCLARRHDSPRFVWMMTGLAIRMAQYLGLQRDGSQFDHLSPFEVEIRRRVWWVVFLLDMRSSQDQGTEPTITNGSFDTKIPSNIDEADIHPESKEAPAERHGVTDSTFARIHASMTQIQIKMMSAHVAGLPEQHRLLNELYEKMEQDYLQYTTESVNIRYWVADTVTRLTMAKMTLLVLLPARSPGPSEHLSNDIKNILLISAIEVAEYNHELNVTEACRQWRWVYQTFVHWYAIVYLMVEICHRPWSPLVERAWFALHSSWLLPPQTHIDNNLRIWIPLRKLVDKARKHRDTELKRLRVDSHSAARLEVEDQNIPLPSSSGPFPKGGSANLFRQRWRKLVGIADAPDQGSIPYGNWAAALADMSTLPDYTRHPLEKLNPAYGTDNVASHADFERKNFGVNGEQAGQTMENIIMKDHEVATSVNPPNELLVGQSEEPSYQSFPAVSTAGDLSDDTNRDNRFAPWSFVDPDSLVDPLPDLDLDLMDADVDLEFNWYNWVEFAKGMESGATQNST